MGITEIINAVIQNWFLTVFACTVLYFMIKLGNAYIDRFNNKKVDLLPDDLTVNHVRSIVWYHSRGKLRYIESVLIENDIHTRKDEITRKIKNALEERSTVYIDYLNSIDCNIKRLGTFYCDVFEFDPFFKELMSVVLKPYRSEDHTKEIAVKLKDIAEIMYEYQEKANIKVEEEFERLSNIKK